MVISKRTAVLINYRNGAEYICSTGMGQCYTVQGKKTILITSIKRDNILSGTETSSLKQKRNLARKFDAFDPCTAEKYYFEQVAKETRKMG